MAECGTTYIKGGDHYLSAEGFSEVSKRRSKKTVTGFSYKEVTGDLGEHDFNRSWRQRHHELSHE